jgi:hypothetical protein
MKILLVISACLAALPLAATPSFASGYGPAPFYRPDVNSVRPFWRHTRATEDDGTRVNDVKDDKATDPAGHPQSDPAQDAPAGSVN